MFISNKGRCKEEARHLHFGQPRRQGAGGQFSLSSSHIGVGTPCSIYRAEEGERVPERAQDYSTPRRWQWSESNGNMSEGFVLRTRECVGWYSVFGEEMTTSISLSLFLLFQLYEKANDAKPIIPRPRGESSHRHA